MNKPSSLDSKLNRLGSLARDLPSQAARDEFGRVLLGTNNILIARAAQLIARAGDRGLVSALISAFTRLLDMPAAFDKGCRAKSAIPQALQALSIYSSDEHLRQRIQEAASTHRDPRVLEAFHRGFGQ